MQNTSVQTHRSNSVDLAEPLTTGKPVGESSGDEGAHATGTMQAIVQRSYGSAEVLKLDSLERPKIGDKEVLVQVRAAGLDLGTWHLMNGTPYLIRILGFGFSRPKQITPGMDVAGRVSAVGSAVTRFTPGDEVYGIAKGSFAEYACASEDKLIPKPENLSFESAAVAPVSGITALEALTDVGNLQAGQRVLIVGASGGVGSFAVQIAKNLGAHVTGVSSASKMDLVRSLGADHAIDYRTDYLADRSQSYDLIIDIGGRNKVSSLRGVLGEHGTLVFVGGEGGNRITGGIGRQIGACLMSPFLRQNLKMFVSAEKLSMIVRFGDFIKSGAVVPSIGQRYALKDVAESIRDLESGKIRGKSVIVVGD